jgi:hypothetical protein
VGKNVPSGQGLQALAPAAEKVPGGHCAQAAAESAPAPLAVPAAQSAPSAVAPPAEMKRPPSDSVQNGAPAVLEKEPGAHGAHVDGDEAPCAPENLPAAHSVQVVLAEKAEKEPAAQRAQLPLPPLGAMVPGAHGVQLLLPAGAALPGSHAAQLDTVVAPEKALLVPAGHSAQREAAEE